MQLSRGIVYNFRDFFKYIPVAILNENEMEFEICKKILYEIRENKYNTNSSGIKNKF